MMPAQRFEQFIQGPQSPSYRGEGGARADGDAPKIGSPNGRVAPSAVPRTTNHQPGRNGAARGFSKAKKEKICLLTSLGMSRRQAAAHVGCHHATITRAAARDPEFEQALLEAESLSELEPLTRIVSAGRKSWRAAVWILERTQPQKYGRYQGGPVPWNKVRDALDELVQQIINELPGQPHLHARIWQQMVEIANRLRSHNTDRQETNEAEVATEHANHTARNDRQLTGNDSPPV